MYTDISLETMILYVTTLQQFTFELTSPPTMLPEPQVEKTRHYDSLEDVDAMGCDFEQSFFPGPSCYMLVL